jgi:phytoene synthase
MSTSIIHWESHLLRLAQEALNSHVPDEHQPCDNSQLLDKAYRYCDQLTQLHSKTFYMASGLLPKAKRRAARALYSFCRVSDDLVDRTPDDPLGKLENWRINSVATEPTGEDAVILAWSDARHCYQIPWRYSEQLINGVAKDLEQTRYQTFEELTTYCYGVACTVGLMSMHIIGYSSEEAITYAIRLGVALQMTNILRDVGEDWRAGRVYLPQQELATFGMSEADIAQGAVTAQWREFIRFQIDRNRKLYSEAMPGIRLLNPDGRFAIGAAAELYQAILEVIEAHDYDVFNHRASVSKWGKLRRLPGIWWRSNRNGYVSPDGVKPA